MPKGQSLVLLIALLCWSGRVWAGNVPDWAIGRWQAVSLATGPDILGWGRHGEIAIVDMLGATRVEFTRTSLTGARTGLSIETGENRARMFLGGASGITARAGSARFRTLFPVRADPVVLGRFFTIEPDAEVPFATLALAHCTELGPVPVARDGQGQLVPGIQRGHCPDLRIFRYPDAGHIALPGALGGWVIYEPVRE